MNNIGVDVKGKAEAGDWITDVAIKNNRFFGTGNHILLVQSVRNVEISDNTSAGGKGAACALAHPDASESIQINHNTFFENRGWLFMGRASPILKNATFSDNLVLETTSIGILQTRLTEFFKSWNFSNNLWELNAETNQEQITLVAVPIRNVEPVSRDPQHARFLHPTKNSPLIKRGSGGELTDFIGAFGPSDD